MHVPQTEVILRHDGAELARVTLPPGEYVIGRNPDVEIHADTPLISRRHAQLTINYDHLLIEDLGSSNGTFVNEQPIAECTRLFPNQAVRLGPDITVEFHRQRAPSEPGVSLAPAQQTIRRFLPDEVLAEKRYAIGKVVAQGGMGAILDAQQAAMRRQVAMKVMLESAEPADVARFVEEAQVTGQLAHPNIVPVYELGVDENGQLFYTMKMVRGITLKKVLELLAEGVPETLKKYPLPALLTIFQKVCDALAFAHSKGVIHRDLKPENIMLDDFGVVLVMDWGLAKVIGAARTRRDTLAGTALHSTVASARAAEPELGSTMAGSIMGTPQYMAPEQARGEIDLLDARTDLYALGAILYTMLTLRPPVTGADVHEVIDKVARGEVESLIVGQAPRLPTAAGQPKRSPYNHLPGGRIPDSLAAVVRKAMALDPAQRYPSVAELQRDLTAYQTGFATSAERAGLAKQLALLIRRHKGIATTAFAAWLIITTLAVWFVVNVAHERNRAAREAARAKAALADLKATAPDLLALAASEAGLQRYESALKKADAALALDPSLAAARWRRAWVLVAQERLPEALEALHEAADQDPTNKRNAALIPLVEKMAAAPADKRHEFELIKPLYDHLTTVGAVGEATPLLPHLKLGNDARLKLVKERVERWLGKPEAGAGAPWSVSLSKGELTVILVGLRIGTLEHLHGLPIDALLIDACGLTSIEPLRGMRLVRLEAKRNPIESLSSIEGMPIEFLSIANAPLTDLSPVRGMPLKYFYCSNLRNVTDIRPLAGMPLEVLQMSNGPVSDFSALLGMPLRTLSVASTRFAEGRALAGMPLGELDLTYCSGFTDASTLVGLPLRVLKARFCAITDFTPLLRIPTLESLETTAPLDKLLPLRAHPGLKQIKLGDAPYRPVAEFWAAYDAQQAAGKK